MGLASSPGGPRRAPYVCFSVWGGWGNVTFANHTFLPREWKADGTWQPARFRGPCDFESWKRCWMVFEVAMIMLGAASPGALLAYRAGVEKLHTRWPAYWHRIAVAEALARSTQWDRMLEDRLSADEKDPTFISERAAAATDVWDRIIEDSAFVACSGG